MRVALIAALLLCSSCIVPAPSNESAPARPVQGANTAPIQIKNGANFGDKVELTGLIISPGSVAPGEAVKVSLFFKVLDEIPADYTVFVHVEDVDGRTDRLNADHAPAGGQYPTSKWKKGETVRDDFQIYVPPQLQVRGMNILLGLWEPRTDSRMPLKNLDAVRHDGNNRVLVGQFPVVAQ